MKRTRKDLIGDYVEVKLEENPRVACIRDLGDISKIPKPVATDMFRFVSFITDVANVMEGAIVKYVHRGKVSPATMREEFEILRKFRILFDDLRIMNIATLCDYSKKKLKKVMPHAVMWKSIARINFLVEKLYVLTPEPNPRDTFESYLVENELFVVDKPVADMSIREVMWSINLLQMKWHKITMSEHLVQYILALEYRVSVFIVGIFDNREIMDDFVYVQEFPDKATGKKKYAASQKFIDDTSLIFASFKRMFMMGCDIEKVYIKDVFNGTEYLPLFAQTSPAYENFLRLVHEQTDKLISDGIMNDFTTAYISNTIRPGEKAIFVRETLQTEVSDPGLILERTRYKGALTNLRSALFKKREPKDVFWETEFCPKAGKRPTYAAKLMQIRVIDSLFITFCNFPFFQNSVCLAQSFWNHIDSIRRQEYPHVIERMHGFDVIYKGKIIKCETPIFASYVYFMLMIIYHKCTHSFGDLKPLARAVFADDPTDQSALELRKLESERDTVTQDKDCQYVYRVRNVF